MNFIKNELDIRALPNIYRCNDGTHATRAAWELRRTELRRALAEHEYGTAPTGRDDNLLDDPSVVTTEETKNAAPTLCAGKVTGEYFNVSFPTETGTFSFPVQLFTPNNARKPSPLFLFLNFSDAVPEKYFPLEEITDAGFAVALLYYQDITTDNGDYANGIAGCFPSMGTTEETRIPTAWGKLRMWAFAASRLLDVLLRRDDIAHDQIVAVGHSRLGKTAMLAAAYDDRFAGACVNESGCSGAAITRTKTGEDVAFITRTFPFWFCPNYRQYADREYEMPIDQHFLAALIAPRPLCIGSAWEDKWADPHREFLCAVTAAGTHEFLSTGIEPTFDDLRTQNGVPVNAYPTPDTTYRFACGNVQYHVRRGTHYFSREDWNKYSAFWGEKFF